MKTSLIPAIAAAIMLLGGCSAYGGLGGLGGILGGDTYRDDPYRSGSYGYEPYRGPDNYGTNYRLQRLRAPGFAIWPCRDRPGRADRSEFGSRNRSYRFARFAP